TEVKFGEWIEQGFKLYKNNFGIVVLASLVAAALTVVTMGILAGPMAAGVCMITLRLFDGTEPKPEVGMVFRGFNYFLNSFLFFLVWGVGLIVVSFLLSIVPCVGQLAALFVIWAVQTLLMFGIFFIVDEEMEFWPASMKSIDNVKVNFWPFLGFFIVVSIIGSIGAILCGIGAVITAPIQACILTVAYRDIFRGKTYTPASEDPSSGKNAPESVKPAGTSENQEPSGTETEEKATE
ncbi:MAG: hypothetical protein ACOCTM_04375, partial [Bacteroidota bacterium]